MPLRDDIIAEARTWIGTPFLHQGRIKGQGVDCVGLIMGVAKAVGLPGVDQVLQDPRSHVYKERPAAGQLLKRLHSLLRQIPRDGARPGDMLCLWVADNPQHVLLLSYQRHVIHATSEKERVVEHLIPHHWWRRSAAFVLPGVS